MTRVLVLGMSEAALIALAAIKSIKCETAVSVDARDWDFADIQPPPRRDDVFSGGGRSKGEKKRAARERRMRGGY